MSRHIAIGVVAISIAISFATRPATTRAAGEGWSDDMAAAMEIANRAGKHILMQFNGSDWCGWCIKLNEEIFAEDEFRNEAPKHFVLVEFDFPRDKSKLSAETIAQNEKWRNRIGVSSFPAVYLATADGTPYALTGYLMESTPSEYVEHLTALQTAKKISDQALAEADSAKGAKKAALLDKVIANPAIIVDGREKIVDQIIELDVNNRLGLKEKYAKIRQRQRIATDVTNIENLAFHGKFDQALNAVDEMLEKYELQRAEAQQVMAVKIQLLVYKEDFKAALALTDQVIELAPDTELALRVKTVQPRLEQIVVEQKAAIAGSEDDENVSEDNNATDKAISKS